MTGFIGLFTVCLLGLLVKTRGLRQERQLGNNIPQHEAFLSLKELMLCGLMTVAPLHDCDSFENENEGGGESDQL